MIDEINLYKVEHRTDILSNAAKVIKYFLLFTVIMLIQVMEVFIFYVTRYWHNIKI